MISRHHRREIAISHSLILIHSKDMRNLQITEDEETALVNAFLFIHDLGVPPHLEEDKAFDTLWDKISDPSPFDYS